MLSGFRMDIWKMSGPGTIFRLECLCTKLVSHLTYVNCETECLGLLGFGGEGQMHPEYLK